MTLKQYKKLRTVRVDALTDYTKAIGLLQPKYLNLLLARNRDKFTKMWGKQTFCLTTHYRSWVWAKIFKEDMFFVHSGTRGTSIEFLHPYGNLNSYAPTAIAFAMMLISDLREV